MSDRLTKAYAELIEGPHGLPAVQVVDWFDQHLRIRFVTSLRQRFFNLPHEDVDEAWSAVLMKIYTEGLHGRHWERLEHVIGWCMSFGNSHLNFIMMRGVHQRTRSAQDGFVQAISQLEKERYEEIMNTADPASIDHTPQLGRSADWLINAINELKPKQRAAIELAIYADHSPSTASEYVEQTAHGFKNVRNSALYNIAMASPQMSQLNDLDRTDPWVIAARREMSSTQWNAFDLTVLQGVSLSKAGEMLGTSASAVGVNKQMAVLKLASCYSTYGKDVA